MIYATIKQVTEYNVTMESGNVHGIETTYRHKPELLALILIATPVGYEYEGSKPQGTRSVEIINVKELEETLEYVLGVNRIGTQLSKLNPMDFYEWIRGFDLSEIPLVLVMYKGNQDTLKKVIGARAANWAQYYKGKVSSSGDLIKVSFGGSPAMFIPEALKENNKLLARQYGT